MGEIEQQAARWALAIWEGKTSPEVLPFSVRCSVPPGSTGWCSFGFTHPSRLAHLHHSAARRSAVCRCCPRRTVNPARRIRPSREDPLGGLDSVAEACRAWKDSVATPGKSEVLQAARRGARALHQSCAASTRA
jgi:hypothetical protein